jgi:hypothetical protein
MALFEGFNLTNIRSFISPKNYVPGSMERFIIPIITDVRKFPDNSSLLACNSKAMAIRKGDRVILSGESISQNCRGYDVAVINSNYKSRRNKFAYVACCLPSTFSNKCQIAYGIAKVHLSPGEGYRRVMWKIEGGDGCHPWSPIFIPNPNPSGVDDEDNGVLICLVSNLHKKFEDFLVVIDAATMKEISRVEFKDPKVQMASYYIPSFYFA